MSEFKFEVQNSDQIPTVRMAVIEILFEYYEFALGNNTQYGGKLMEHVCEV
jgi:hypothetical protein